MDGGATNMKLVTFQIETSKGDFLDLSLMRNLSCLLPQL